MTEIPRNSFHKTKRRHWQRFSRSSRQGLFFSLTIAPLANPAVSSTKAERHVQRGVTLYHADNGISVHYVNYGKGREALILIRGRTMNE